ncbi:DNase I-like protein [Ascobolus immersus RN42]|uniref:DNase I-like protein n=1 Tax=Ascobolus immersus RN42 TaxID=1160509 RepID=A0A3N4IM70_ASCIM|nr:DNase I-like protein [Ascobolus immersus RN42]
MPSKSHLTLYLFTYNLALLPINPPHFTANFLSNLNPAAPQPDLIVLSLQEVAPAWISMLPSPNALTKHLTPIIEAVQNSTREQFGLGSDERGYSIVGRHSIGPTAVLVFARDREAVREVQCVEKGFLWRETGYKGAVGIKVWYSEDGSARETTELVFVGTHLIHGETQWEARNANWESTVRGLVFEDVQEDGGRRLSGIYDKDSYLFVLGDLNYRTGDEPPKEEDHEKFPQPSSSRIKTRGIITNLLAKDQLLREKRQGKTLHGLTEEDIFFLPTYKLKDKSGTISGSSAIGANYEQAAQDPEHITWAAHRWPSYTDRILYLPASPEVKPHNYQAVPSMMGSDHKPVTLHISIPKQIPEAKGDDVRLQPPFPLDEEWKSKRDVARKAEAMLGWGAWVGATRQGMATAAGTGIGLMAAAYYLKTAWV